MGFIEREREKVNEGGRGEKETELGERGIDEGNWERGKRNGKIGREGKRNGTLEREGKKEGKIG